MTKNKLILIIFILSSIFLLTIFSINETKTVNDINGELIAEHLEFKSGYVHFRKYAVDGYANGEEKSIALLYSEFYK